jgi:Ca2+-binding EF-hand superfamily protein
VGRRYQDYCDAFEKYDSDGSGALDQSEIAGILGDLGLDVMDHVVWELMGYFDRDNSGLIEFSEFQSLMDTIRRRHGFCTSDYVALVAAFEKFDCDGNYQLDVKEFSTLLAYQGYSMPDITADIVINGMDKDVQGKLSLREFLYAMREVRAAEVDRLQECMESPDVDMNNSGTIGYDECMALLLSLGHWPDLDALFQSAAAAGLEEDDDDWSISKVWQVLCEFRFRQGLNRQQSAEVQDCFQQFVNLDLHRPEFEGNDESRLSNKTVRSALQHLGCQLSLERVHFLLDQVDIRRRGALDLEEFKTIFRMVRELDICVIRETFMRLADYIDECLSPAEAMEALQELGVQYYNTDLAQRFDNLNKPRINLYAFFEVAVEVRLENIEFMKRNSGFTIAEIEQCRQEFQKYDTNNNGLLERNEASSLLAELLPELPASPELKTRVLGLLADTNEAGKLTYVDYPPFKRAVFNVRDEQYQKREDIAISMSELGPAEVHEFRRQFLDPSICRTCYTIFPTVSFDDITKLVGKVCPLGHKNYLKLQELFEEVRRLDFGTQPRDDNLFGFPEFLILMKKMVDCNFGEVGNNNNNVNSRKQGRHRLARALTASAFKA